MKLDWRANVAALLLILLPAVAQGGGDPEAETTTPIPVEEDSTKEAPQEANPPTSSAVSPAKSRRLSLVLASLQCHKTTEDGADEVYIVVAGKNNRGESVAAILPGDGRHFDMNDDPGFGCDSPNGDSHCLNRRDLFVGDFTPGTIWGFDVNFLEIDGGNTAGVQAALVEILQKIDDPYAQGAGAILAALTAAGFKIEDTDDWLGEVGVQISNVGLNPSVNWEHKARIASIVDHPDRPGDPGSKVVNLNGDGSGYSAWIRVIE